MRLSPERFPGLDEWVRLDGPAGTLPVDTSIDAMHAYLTSSAPANTGGSFDASRRTTALVDDVREPSRGAVRRRRLASHLRTEQRRRSSSRSRGHSHAPGRDRNASSAPSSITTRTSRRGCSPPRDAGAACPMIPINPANGTIDLGDLELELGRGDVAWVALTGASNLNGWAPDLRAAHRAHPRRPAPDCTSTQWRALRISRST